MPHDERLPLEDCAKTEEAKTEISAKPYREAVGSLMYLMTGTRPDLAYFIREVSQFLANHTGMPSNEDLNTSAAHETLEFPLEGKQDCGCSTRTCISPLTRTPITHSADTSDAVLEDTSRCSATVQSAGFPENTTSLCYLQGKLITLPMLLHAGALFFSNFYSKRWDTTAANQR